MRGIDERAILHYHIPAVILMENAGRACAEEAVRLTGGCPKKAVILAGNGNNGGDGFVAARHLSNLGAFVRVYFYGPARDLKKEARLNLDILRRMKIQVVGPPSAAKLKKELRGYAIIIDALFGTGLSRAITGPRRVAVEALNASGRPALSIDIPSGLSADDGMPWGGSGAPCVRADVTVALGLPKIGFYARGARAFTGRIVVRDISLPKTLLGRVNK